MKFIRLNGSIARKNVTPYRIDWESESRSKIQTQVKQALQTIWEGHVVYEEFPVVGTRMTLDIVNLTRKIAIEVQGGQHTKFTKFFHKDALDFFEQIGRDDDKQKWCNLNSIRLVEIHQKDWPMTIEELQETYQL